MINLSNMNEVNIRIKILNHVADWNKERASHSKNEDDKMRFIHNFSECRAEVMELEQIDFPEVFGVECRFK